MSRPSVSVIVPFHGTDEEARATITAICTIERAADDELIVVDNSGAGAVPDHPGVRVVPADREHSSYYARNAGAELAGGEWLLFIDSDCKPEPDLIARYFDSPPAERVGAVVGEVHGVADQDALVSRYARSRGHLGQAHHFNSAFRPWGVTANILVRRAAWEDVGGFHEGVRSAGDTEFSWRLQDAGWELEYAANAAVEHRHRERLRPLARQAARVGAGRAWVSRRYPSALPAPRLVRPVARAAAGVVVWGLTFRFERAAFKALDGIYEASRWSAYWLSNTPPDAHRETAAGAAPVAAIAGAFPDRDDPGAIAAARALGGQVRIEAAARPVRVDRRAARELEIAWAEDDGALRRAGAVAWIATRRPLRTVAFVIRRSTAPRLRDVASSARRLLSAGTRELHAVGGADARRDAAALSALTGIRHD